MAHGTHVYPDAPAAAPPETPSPFTAAPLPAWRALRVAKDGTHHVLDTTPAYAGRFDEVLPFHAPGLAPVRRGDRAWHITVDGEPAYARRFHRTFGVYEERAAVVSADGWHHVHADGEDAYPQRHAWCGNFQGSRCSVRDAEGRYHHVDREGRPAYAERWRYAGDFREGAAVVQAGDGRSTHVDEDGVLLHGAWFLDLGVYHKGHAAARDGRGWTHVGRDGRPLYDRRFAMVEPFYNGQARVERSDGALEVIDETGRTIVELRAPLRGEFQSLSADLVGFWRTDTLAAAVRLGVFDALPARAEEVAARCSLPLDGAGRLLDALGELKVAHRDARGRWDATARGAFLRSHHPLTLADAALEYAGPLRERWARLPEALRSEDWRPGDVFREVAATPERCEPHHRMLRSYALHDYAPLVGRLPIRAGDVVVDAGGGKGALAGMVAREYAEVRVVVLDLPGVVQRVSLDGGVRVVGADLFEPWPVRADVVLLARVLHDWNDDGAACILERAAEALRPGGRVVVVEMLRDGDAHRGALCDLHLLAVSGGRERSFTEYERLMDRAGLKAAPVRREPGLCQVVVGSAASL